MPSPTTINRRAREYGSRLKQFLPDCVADTGADAVIPDGTKRYSQDEDRSYHSVQATLDEDINDESRSLMDLSVNADWDETATELDNIGVVIDDRRVVERLQAIHPEWSITALDNFYRGTVREIADVTIEHVDIRDRNWLEETLAGADIVMHLAALSGVEDCDENTDLAHAVNVNGTNNVAWFFRQHGAGLIFPASMAILGDPDEFPITPAQPRDPLNWYSRTKVLGEQMIEMLAEEAFPAIST